jgi:hypothetical protein
MSRQSCSRTLAAAEGAQYLAEILGFQACNLQGGDSAR